MKTQNISITTNEKIGLISNLTTMLSAGIPILEAVDSISEDSKGNQKKLLLTLRADLEQGQHVYYAFAKFPRIFDKVTVNILKASEEAGTLDITLKDLQENIRKDAEFKDRIKSTMVYPMFIMVVFVGVMLMILLVVVPKIASVFERLNVVLPLPTKIMIFVSNNLINNTVPVLVGLSVIGGGTFFLFRSKSQMIVHFLTGLPGLSKLVQEIDLTRFTRSMYLLLNAGIPITAALELTRDIVMRKEVAIVIKRCHNAVSSGKKLSDGLKGSKKIFPSIIVRIIEAGERSGSLDKSMLDCSNYLDYQVSNTLKTLTTLIEPLMLVLVGILIGGMMLAIIAPIYSIIGQVGGH